MDREIRFVREREKRAFTSDDAPVPVVFRRELDDAEEYFVDANVREEVPAHRKVRDEDYFSRRPFSRFVFDFILHGVPEAKSPSLALEHSGFAETGRDVYDERETADV